MSLRWNSMYLSSLGTGLGQIDPTYVGDAIDFDRCDWSRASNLRENSTLDHSILCASNAGFVG